MQRAGRRGSYKPLKEAGSDYVVSVELTKGLRVTKQNRRSNLHRNAFTVLPFLFPGPIISGLVISVGGHCAPSSVRHRPE